MDGLAFPASSFASTTSFILQDPFKPSTFYFLHNNVTLCLPQYLSLFKIDLTIWVRQQNESDFTFYNIDLEVYIHNITPVSHWGRQRLLPSTCYDAYTHLSLLALSSNSSYTLAGFRYSWPGLSLKLPQWSINVRLGFFRF
jgi:hypothetical protein